MGHSQHSGSDSGIVLSGGDGGPPVRRTPDDSGIVLHGGGGPERHTPDQRARTFRRAIAERVLRVLTTAYVTRPEPVRAEARRRGITVEQLVAAHIARVIMDKVDNEDR